MATETEAQDLGTLRIDLAERARVVAGGCRTRSDEHLHCARRAARLHLALGLPTALLAAAAGAALLAAPGEAVIATAAGVLALMVAALTAVTTLLQPLESAGAHRRAADGFASLDTRLWTFQARTAALDVSAEELLDAFQQLLDDRDGLARDAPLIGEGAKRRVARQNSGRAKREKAARRRARQERESASSGLRGTSDPGAARAYPA
jgi:hypothetical protein